MLCIPSKIVTENALLQLTSSTMAVKQHDHRLQIAESLACYGNRPYRYHLPWAR